MYGREAFESSKFLSEEKPFEKQVSPLNSTPLGLLQGTDPARSLPCERYYSRIWDAFLWCTSYRNHSPVIFILCFFIWVSFLHFTLIFVCLFVCTTTLTTASTLSYAHLPFNMIPKMLSGAILCPRSPTHCLSWSAQRLHSKNACWTSNYWILAKS